MNEERTYHESEWAVGRWDYFNEGRAVEPKSFCQFWRTVLVYATVKQVLSPFRRLGKATPKVPLPRIPFAGRAIALSAKGGVFLVQGVARLLWRLTFPLRAALKPAGRLAFTGAVNAGEQVGDFNECHREGVKQFGFGLVLTLYGALVVFLLVICLFVSWLWTLVAIGGIVGGLFAFYGFFRSGTAALVLQVLGLFWGVAVAAKHGVCPPARIVRG